MPERANDGVRMVEATSESVKGEGSFSGSTLARPPSEFSADDGSVSNS